MSSLPEYQALLLSAQLCHQANLDLCTSSENWETQSNIRIGNEIIHSLYMNLYNSQLDFAFLESSADLIMTKCRLSHL